jgi:hypothetical protein
MNRESKISMSQHAISEERPGNFLDKEDAGYWRLDVSKSIVDASDYNVLEEGGSAGEGSGSESTEEKSVVDDGDGEFDNLVG